MHVYSHVCVDLQQMHGESDHSYVLVHIHCNGYCVQNIATDR